MNSMDEVVKFNDLMKKVQSRKDNDPNKDKEYKEIMSKIILRASELMESVNFLTHEIQEHKAGMVQAAAIHEKMQNLEIEKITGYEATKNLNKQIYDAYMVLINQEAHYGTKKYTGLLKVQSVPAQVTMMKEPPTEKKNGKKKE